jgi:hypothetical protein
MTLDTDEPERNARYLALTCWRSQVLNNSMSQPHEKFLL